MCFSYLGENACFIAFLSQVQLFLFFLLYSLGRDIMHLSFLPYFLSSSLPLFFPSICSANPYICESDFIHSSQARPTVAYHLVFVFLNCGKIPYVFINRVLLEHNHAILIIYSCFLATMAELSFEKLLRRVCGPQSMKYLLFTKA